MIKAICGKCGHVFMVCVIMGLIQCPQCGSKDTYVAIQCETPPEREG